MKKFKVFMKSSESHSAGYGAVREVVDVVANDDWDAICKAESEHKDFISVSARAV